MNPPLELGKPLPDWEISPIFDEKVPTKEEFLGKPVVLLFFSLTCPGCLGRAIPFANRIVVEHGDFVQVMGIHTHFEGPETSLKTLKDARDEYVIRFPYYQDSGLAATFHAYRAGGTPHWIVVDKNGIVKESLFGSDPNRALLKLDYLLDELKQEN